MEVRHHRVRHHVEVRLQVVLHRQDQLMSQHHLHQEVRQEAHQVVEEAQEVVQVAVHQDVAQVQVQAVEERGKLCIN